MESMSRIRQNTGREYFDCRAKWGVILETGILSRFKKLERYFENKAQYFENTVWEVKWNTGAISKIGDNKGAISKKGHYLGQGQGGTRREEYQEELTRSSSQVQSTCGVGSVISASRSSMSLWIQHLYTRNKNSWVNLANVALMVAPKLG